MEPRQIPALRTHYFSEKEHIAALAIPYVSVATVKLFYSLAAGIALQNVVTHIYLLWSASEVAPIGAQRFDVNAHRDKF